jgi:hypothetical protein
MDKLAALIIKANLALAPRPRIGGLSDSSGIATNPPSQQPRFSAGTSILAFPSFSEVETKPEPQKVKQPFGSRKLSL